MHRPAFIAGDWGTSHLRLFLCDASGRLLEKRVGDGVAQVRAEVKTGVEPDWAARLNAPSTGWRRTHGELPVVLCGMVGANIGWIPVPYVACPTHLQALAQRLVSPPDSTVLIAPGLSCTNRHGAPDVMRGEETQILGALQLFPELASGSQLLCLPGTHSKWVQLEDGRVSLFSTAVTGEVYALITQHSVLVGSPSASDDASFGRGLQQVRDHRALLQQVFECRSRQLSGEFSTAQAASYLSGLLIGTDVQDALRESSSVPITLIGEPALTLRYATACAGLGHSTRQLDGERAALAGLTAYFRHSQPLAQEQAHAGH